jgi:hypothetical protein
MITKEDRMELPNRLLESRWSSAQRRAWLVARRHGPATIGYIANYVSVEENVAVGNATNAVRSLLIKGLLAQDKDGGITATETFL